jgi:bifunctional non-homologous end joining protein LigD
MLWRTSKKRSLPSGFIAPCIPTATAKVPQGPLWIHEVKQDGYRMIAKRGAATRLLTRNGFDWTKRYPRIVAGLEALEVKSATIDGEAVWLGGDGIADFRMLQSRRDDRRVSFYAFDLLELDGKDICKEPLEQRRELLQSLLKGVQDIHFSEHFEGDGEVLFEHVCKFGLEGIVSKRRDLPYESGKSKRWLKTKNPQSPAMLRLAEG